MTPSRPTRVAVVSLLISLPLLSGCGERAGTPPTTADLADPLRMVLIPPDGGSDLDQRIRQRQERIRQRGPGEVDLERLGALFVAKARRSYDSGYYRLAEQCAAVIARQTPDSPAALLLRGEVLHSLHHFAAAERLARRLVAEHDGFRAHGLLGDVLLDVGRLDDALASYRRMEELEPCLQSHVRMARVLWLRGKPAAAREVLELACHAGSRRDPEALAWTYARLANVCLQNGDTAAAATAAGRALEVLPTSAPALLVRGRIERVEGRMADALESTRRAAELDPLPEYLWAHADLLRHLGREREAGRIERRLEARGAAEDPRTFSLYLSGRGRRLDEALRLAENELKVRQDVHTHDAVAWALLANGRVAAAWQAEERALREGTVDARLLYHAGAIAAAAGRHDRARSYLDRAAELAPMLLPSEQRDLDVRRRSL